MPEVTHPASRLTIRGVHARPLELRATVRLLEALRNPFRLLGTSGLVGVAIAGLEMAAWEVLAKANGRTLVELLGGEPRPIPGAVGLEVTFAG